MLRIKVRAQCIQNALPTFNGKYLLHNTKGSFFHLHVKTAITSSEIRKIGEK